MIQLVAVRAAAEQLGRTPSAVRQAAGKGELPGLRLGRAVRVAVDPVPRRRAELAALLPAPTYTIRDLAQAWHLHPDTLQRQARARQIPMVLRQGAWTISRARLAQFLAEHLWGAP